MFELQEYEKKTEGSHLPAEASHKVLKCFAGLTVGENGVLVLLAFCHVYHSKLVGLSTVSTINKTRELH